MPLEQLDTRVAQQLQIDAIEPVDFTVFGRNQSGPVELDITHLPAITRGILELLAEMRSI